MRAAMAFRMVHSERPLQEKMTLFWHNYFATGFTKSRGKVHGENATLLWPPSRRRTRWAEGQIELLRDNAVGSCATCCLIAQDRRADLADGDSNTKEQAPGEFSARVDELFTRASAITRRDVYAAARLFTVLEPELSGTRRIDPIRSRHLQGDEHDTSAKTFSFPISATAAGRSGAVGLVGDAGRDRPDQRARHAP